MKSILSPLLLLAVASAGAVPEQMTFHELPLADGGVLRYALVLPEDFDPERAYPALLALPPGPQDEAMVAVGLRRYWGRQAASRGWLVVSPAAPGGIPFHHGDERHLPALMDHVRAQVRVEEGRFHLAGMSNGGRSAFGLALARPDDFLSLTVLPGYPPSDVDDEGLQRLAALPVRMYVGGRDRGWVARMAETRRRLEKLGGDVELTIFPDEGHVPPSLDGGRVLRDLDALRADLERKNGR